MRIMITGAGGLVGRAAVSHCNSQGEQVIALDHRSLDISDESSVNAAFDHERPDLVINCAAWTDVDGCELDRERARTANAGGPELLALACKSIGALLITISTDYVFDGEKDGFYTQRDQPNPQSVYAVSKLEGERRAQQAWARTIVARSGYIFGLNGTNFLSTFLPRALRGERIQVISDSFGTPTYAPHLAARIYELAQLDLPGLYHVVNAGEGASFEDFARAAFAIARLNSELLESTNMASLKRAAPRPKNSRLKCLLSEALGLRPMPYWKDAVKTFVTGETTPVAAQLGGAR
jgi:dTDP-4-dehydrorhamnose reductase